MLFNPSIDDLSKNAGNAYIATILMSARAKEIEVKTTLAGSSNEAIEIAAIELLNGDIEGVSQS